MLVTGNVMIDRKALGEPQNVVVEDERHLGELSKWAEAGKANGAHIWVQLNHPGKQSPRTLSKQPVAPSAIPLKGILSKFFNTPRALEHEEVIDLIQRYGNAARVIKKAGFTGVQIHGAHGYLVSQFLSPNHNQRSDDWGGDAQKRMRFVVEVYKSIRANVGPNFPISIKMNSADFQRGGFTEEESLEVVRTLSSLGMDLIEISGGTYERPVMMDGVKKESTLKREAYFLEFAAKAKAVASCPVVVTGGFRSENAMNEALQSGATDMIGIARPLVAMPDLPNRIQAGNYSTIQAPYFRSGLKFLDKNSSMFEIMMYEQQMRKIGEGKEVKMKNAGFWSAIPYLLKNISPRRDKNAC